MKILPHVVLIGGLLLAACSNSAPKCADKPTIDLVLQIAREEIVRQLGQPMVNQLEMRLDAIRTTASDSKTGAQQCAAQLIFKGPAGESKSDITYKSERTDQDGRQYVTVFGL